MRAHTSFKVKEYLMGKFLTFRPHYAGTQKKAKYPIPLYGVAAHVGIEPISCSTRYHIRPSATSHAQTADLALLTPAISIWENGKTPDIA